ncbi:MAG: GNAT family N-acetyltransferase [Nocardioidaceae bacterium]
MGTLLYDGDCGFCTSSARLLQRWVPTEADVQPWQRVDLRSLGVTPRQAAESVQWLDGTVHEEGPDAIGAYLQSSQMPAWRAVGRGLKLRPVRALAWPVYRLVARYRHKLPGGTPACQTPALRATPPASEQRPAPPAPGEVRRRRASDINACVRLLHAVYGDGQYPVYLPDHPDEWLTARDVMAAWVVQPEGRVIGHVAVVRLDQDLVEAMRWREVTGRDPATLAGVSQLMVSPDARGAGVGSRLLETAVSDIRQRGLHPVLEVVDASVDAIEMYERRGWQLVAIYPWGRPVDDLQIRYYEAP